MIKKPIDRCFYLAGVFTLILLMNSKNIKVSNPREIAIQLEIVGTTTYAPY